MPNINFNNKRIAKNTMYLYFRMLLTMAVSLFTVRIVLDILGIQDYGIYEVVAGIVISFSFLSSSLATASQRFFSFEIGKNNFDRLTKLFTLCIFSYIIISLIILILCETIGVWFLNNQLVIPTTRIQAANVVFQMSIASFVVTIIRSPYQAIIIANEKMTAYAYVSILESILKLGLVYLLMYFVHHRLELYAVFLFVISLSVTVFYIIYCYYKFPETKIKLYWDIKELRNIFSFACWNLFGNISFILLTQGLNFILNIFFGPVVNAARGVSIQVQTAVNQFFHNFQTAINPQIIKSYAQKDLKQMYKLIFFSTKISFCLILILIAPLFTRTEYILGLWLNNIPEYTPVFIRLMLIISLFETLGNPLLVGNQATGNIKKFMLLVGCLWWFVLPFSYIAFVKGAEPYMAFIIQILFAIIAHGIRIYISSKSITLPVLLYLNLLLKIGVNTIIILIIASILSLIIADGVLGTTIYILLIWIIAGLCTLYLVFNKFERNQLNFYCLNFIYKIKKNGINK